MTPRTPITGEEVGAGHVISVAEALKQAFQRADPDAIHHFDWADFGSYKPTDKGQAVIDALVERLGLAEDYVAYADRRYQQGYEDALRSAATAARQQGEGEC